MANYKLICKKTVRNNVFRRKQTTNKVLRKIFRGFEVINKVRLIFLGPKDIFRVKETQNKIPLIFLDVNVFMKSKIIRF